MGMSVLLNAISPLFYFFYCVVNKFINFPKDKMSFSSEILTRFPHPRRTKFALQLSAQLENVTDLKAEGDDFRWYLKLKCSHCGDETPELVYLSLLENQPLKGGRGSASLVLKCKLCLRENSIDIIKDSLSSYTFDDVPQFKTIVVFDCRGVEPTVFDPRIGWTASGLETNTKFSDVDLSQLEWADFDEKLKESVGIYEVRHRFVRA